MKIVTIIQARMGSTRLPGKVLKEVLGKPLLAYQIERVRRSARTDRIVVATTVKPEDEPIVALCRELQVDVFRGSENDVLSRYYGAATEAGADVVVRLTSDCPLIDAGVVDRVIEAFLASPGGAYDYTSNCYERTYPRGMDTEVFSIAALKEANERAALPSEREHVTPYIITRPERFRMTNVAYFSDQGRHRWTVDTPEDFELIQRILEALYPGKPAFTLEDALALLERYPDWANLNSHIEQKKAY